MTLFALSFFIGVGATAIMDLWGLLRKLLFGGKGLDYRLVGRWIGHMPQGRFRHDAIAAAARVQSLITHAVFGTGLYLSALMARALAITAL